MANSISKTTVESIRPKDKNQTTAYVWELIDKRVPRTEGTQSERTPPVLYLNNPCEVFDETTGERRMLRLLRGEKSVWADEQKMPRELIANNIIEVVFAGGFYFANAPVDAAKIEFLNNHDYNEGKTMRISSKPPKFRLVNTEIQDATKSEFFDQKEDAMAKARSASYEDLIPHAKFLNIPFVDEHGRAKDEGAMRIEYRKYADANPPKFLKSFGDKSLKTRYIIQKAIQDGVIDITVFGAPKWSATGAVITQLDAKKNQLEELTVFGMSEEGKDFMERIS